MQTDDFDDLEDLLAEATAHAAEGQRIAKARQKAANGQADAEMIEMLRKFDEARLWVSVAAVALVHTQECAGCGAKHAMFMGWFEKKQHRTDSHAHKLIRGKPADVALPLIVERHPQGVVECCPDCVECAILIEEALRATTVAEEPHRKEEQE